MPGLLKKNAPLLRATQQVLDVVIVLIVSVWICRYFGPVQLIKAMSIYGIILTIIVFSISGVYKSWREQKISRILGRLSFSWFLVLVGINIILLAQADRDQFEALWPYALFQVELFLVWGGGILAVMISSRLLTRWVLTALRERGYNQRSALIIGTNKTARKLADHITSNRWMGIRLIGFIDNEIDMGFEVTRSGNSLGKVIGSVDDLLNNLGKYSTDMIFVSLPMRNEALIQKIFYCLGTNGKSVYLIPDLITIGIQRARLSYIGGLPIIDMNLFPEWKRVFDVIFSVLIILPTFPLWLVIAFLIKVQDGGPVLYRHRRIMECGKRFNCLKFRTMYPNSDKIFTDLLASDKNLKLEWDKNFKLKNDPRVTPLGRFLRKTSLDELPQFINVLLGNMSVVGARPIVGQELCNFYKDTALTYCSMKPGITGLWQIGRRNDVDDYADRVELDRQYILKYSFWLDLKIILLTIYRILRPKGAY